MSINENNDYEIIQKRWDVLKCINKKYCLGEDSKMYLTRDDHEHTNEYLHPVLVWLRDKKGVILEYILPIYTNSAEKVFVEIDEEKFKILFAEYEILIKQKLNDDQIRQYGLDLLVEIFSKSNQIKWFSPEKIIIGECDLSEETANLLKSLWGPKNRISLREGAFKVWPSKSLGLLATTNDPEVKNDKPTLRIANINRHLANKAAPIFIQRNNGRTFISVFEFKKRKIT